MIITKISKNIRLFANLPTNSRKLVILLTWLEAQDKPILKYIDLYEDADVLVVTINVKEAVWPTTGSQVIAESLATFLDQNTQFDKIFLHGFSVGGYLWGETLLKLQNKQNFQLIIGKIVGQVWDSIINPSAAANGIAYVLAPNQKAVGYLINFMFKLFLGLSYYYTSFHYKKSSRLFHTSIVSAPAVFFCGKNDEIGAYACMKALENAWKKLEIDMKIQYWDNSSHVRHFFKYPEEYKAILAKFLKKVNFS